MPAIYENNIGVEIDSEIICLDEGIFNTKSLRYDSDWINICYRMYHRQLFDSGEHEAIAAAVSTGPM